MQFALPIVSGAAITAARSEGVELFSDGFAILSRWEPEPGYVWNPYGGGLQDERGIGFG